MRKRDGSLQTIREVARLGIMTEYGLRLFLAQGKLPGVYVGSRFYVNTPQLFRQLGLGGEEV